MATKSAAVKGNIFDVQKFKNKDNGAILEATNTLIERNDLYADLPAAPANGGLTQSGLRTVALPTGTLTNVGGYWGNSKATREPYTETVATIKSSYEAPADTFSTLEPAAGQALLKAENEDFLEGMSQGMINLILEGPSVPDQSAVVGLMGRAPYTTYDNEYCFDAGGTGNDLRSCWLVAPGLNTVHLIYNPNHPTLGVEVKDKGEQRIPDPEDATKHRWDIVIEYMLQQGICIRNQKAVKRICNVACGVDALTTANLVNTIIKASLISAVRGKTWMLYCDERLYAELVLGSNNVTKVYTSAQNIYNTELPMIGSNIIIRHMDALNHVIGSGETHVEAA